MKKSIKNQPLVTEEESYENEFKRQVYSQGKICQQFVDLHLKGDRVHIKNIKINIEKIKKIYVIANSDSYPLALWCEYNFEAIIDIPTRAFSLSMLNSYCPLTDKHTLLIFLGENQEEISTYEKILCQSGAKAIKILDNGNLCANTIILNIKEQPPIPVLSFSLKYIMLCLLSIYLGKKNKMLTELYYNVAVRELKKIKESINAIIKNESYILTKSQQIEPENLIITGRNVDFAISKYIENILTTAYETNIFSKDTGELFQLKNKSNIIAIASNDNLFKMLGDYCYKIKIAPFSCDEASSAILYDSALPLINPLLISVIFQLISYNIMNEKQTP